MRAALREGRRALPECLPNPPVGCVLVRGGEIISSGFTQPPAGWDAEAMALAGVAGDLDGVVAYVTLEPCSFEGRTKSCAVTLIERGVERVVVGTVDPDPRNSGAGLELLRDAGVAVELGVLEADVLADLRPHLNLDGCKVVSKRPLG